MTNKEELGSRLQELLRRARTVGDSYKTQLLSSFTEQYKRSQRLSYRQLQLIETWETADLNDEALQQIFDWNDSYLLSGEMQSLFYSAVKYYKNNPPYFSKIIQDFEECKHAGEEYVPTRRNYKKMTENTFFHRYQKVGQKAPLYDRGDLVVGRDGKQLSGNLYLICKTTDNYRAARGSREYLALLIAQPQYSKKWGNTPHWSGKVSSVEEGDVKKFKMKGRRG
ncbi:hypothetical protein CL629_02100 [bacterium]|nr:hypothetical protein [bacterium]|tara:strand:- start:3830 stop:4501 length:672 start_codon:yes stop_codon:yes gene_type:complete